jgi:hypothetical protein
MSHNPEEVDLPSTSEHDPAHNPVKDKTPHVRHPSSKKSVMSVMNTDELLWKTNVRKLKLSYKLFTR